MKNIAFKLESLTFPLIALAMFVCVCLTRPLIPIDETRYVTIAWEMWLKKGWFAPLTLNFEPYDHKPPVLFWMINAFWSVFGVSRWAALIPFVIVSFANIFLTGKIFQKLFPNEKPERAAWLMLGSFPFLMYSTLVMFDMTMCLFVLLSYLCLLNFAEDGKWRWMLGMGLALGFGVLTKGPVAYLYVIFPVLFGPLWNMGNVSKLKWYGGFFTAFLISIPPVLMWLIPVLKATNSDFAFVLVWHQTIDRITGHSPVGSEDSIQVHKRPFYFYLTVLPTILLPWALFPRFWKQIRNLKFDNKMIFLFLWLFATLLAFTCISGKQAHYLVPLIPAAITIIGWMLRDTDMNRIRQVALLMVGVFIVTHIAASQTILPNYDMTNVAEGLAPYHGRDMAYVTNYHGELGFEGRLTEKISDVKYEDLPEWFKGHPDGIAVIRYKDHSQIKNYHQLADFPFRGHRMGLFDQKREP